MKSVLVLSLYKCTDHPALSQRPARNCITDYSLPFKEGGCEGTGVQVRVRTGERKRGERGWFFFSIPAPLTFHSEHYGGLAIFVFTHLPRLYSVNYEVREGLVWLPSCH